MAQLSEKQKKYDHQVLVIIDNILKEAEIETVIAKVIDHNKRIDVLVNNIGFNQLSPILDMSEILWDKLIDSNLKSIFLMTKM